MIPTHQAASARRWSRTPRRKSSAATFALPVELEEDLLEVGWLRDEVDDVVLGDALHEGVHRRLRAGELQRLSVDLNDAYPVEFRERGRVRRGTERDGHVAK